MTEQEGQKLIEELKAQGADDESIAGSFYLMFKDGKIDVEQLGELVGLVGFELNEDFLAMDEDGQKAIFDDEAMAEDDTQPEDTQPNEEVEENAQPEEDETPEEDAQPEEDEDDEAKAMKLMGL